MYEKLEIYKNNVLEIGYLIDNLWRNIDADSKNKREYNKIADQIRKYYVFVNKNYTSEDFESSVVKPEICKFGDELDIYYKTKIAPFHDKVSNEEYLKYNPK